VAKSATKKVRDAGANAQSAPKTGQGNRVSRPRQRGVELKKVQFNVSKTIRAKIDEATKRHDSSLSELLSGAVKRCLRDDVWSPMARNSVSRNRTILPPPELVDMSNRLLELGAVLEQLMSIAGDKPEIDLASRIYLDSRVKLQDLRELYGC
jgi:hypothetical protein